MFITARKELYSIAYVKSIAAVLGFNPSSLEVDNDSVDMELSAKGYKAKIRNPKLELQLKCTQTLPSDDGYLHFALPIKNYNDLRGNDVICPRYLIVVTTPKDVEDWIDLTEDSMQLRHCGYWVSLKDAPETDNTTSVTISIPVENKLSLESLQMLMDNASAGVAL